MSSVPSQAIDCGGKKEFGGLRTDWFTPYRAVSGDRRTKEKSYNAKSVGRKKTEKITTQVCKFFASGSCKKGSKCEFLHEQESRNAMNSVETEKKPTQICKFFAKHGSCKKGSKCEFSHQHPSGNSTS